MVRPKAHDGLQSQAVFVKIAEGVSSHNSVVILPAGAERCKFRHIELLAWNRTDTCRA
jgi:hypothetical protein